MSDVDLREAHVRLQQAMLPVRQRVMLVGWMTALALGLSVLTGLILAGMWLDLAVPLSVWPRRIVVPLATTVAVTFIWLWLRNYRRQNTINELANRIDETTGTGGAVLTGWAFAEQPESVHGPLSQRLAVLAADGAEQDVLNIDEAATFPAKRAGRLWKTVGLGALCLLGFTAIFPRLAWTQVQRIMLPLESQLPYSATVITITPGDTEIVYGEDLTVLAEVQGPGVEDIELVLEFDSSRREVLPMLSESPTMWRTHVSRLTENARYFAQAKNSRSHSHSLTIKMTPQIQAVVCRTTPPKYTRRSTYEGPVPENGIQGVAGTLVEFRIQSNRPLSSGTLKLAYESEVQEVILHSVGDGSSQEVAGEFRLSQDGSFDLRITDSDGLVSTDSITGIIRVLPDYAPVVRLVDPKRVSFATPDIELPITLVGEDDFGVRSAQLFSSVNGQEKSRSDLPTATSAPYLKKSTKLSLPDMNVQPGDEIRLFARVEDNDPSGFKGAESPIATVRIISREQFAQMEVNRKGVEALLNKQRQVQRQLSAIRDAVAKAKQASEESMAADSDQQASPEGRRSARKEAHQTLQAAAKALSQAATDTKRASEAPFPIDIDKELSEMLGDLSKDLDMAAKSIQELSEKLANESPLSQSDLDQLEQLAKQLGERQTSHQRDAMAPVQELAKSFPLVADQARFTDIAKRQTELAERIASIDPEELSDPAVSRRAEELRREQQQLQVALSQLTEDIESHINELPESHEFDRLRDTATEFLRKLRTSPADQAMLRAQEGLLGDSPTEAASHANQAAEHLNRLLSQCDSMGNQACQNCESSFSPTAAMPNRPGLGKSIEQLLKSMNNGRSSKESGQPGGQYSPGMASGTEGDSASSSESIGLYGGVPDTPSEPKMGNGDKSDGGVASLSAGGSQSGTGAEVPAVEGSTRGETAAGVPTQYRDQVSDYFRTLSNELGDQ